MVTHLTHQNYQSRNAIYDYMGTATDLMTTGHSSWLEDIAARGTHIDQWEGGWNATDCLRMAAWAVGNAETFEEMVVLAVAHNGDSDSVAAVAGGLWALAGLPLGKCHTIFNDRLREADIVDEVADRFVAALSL